MCAQMLPKNLYKQSIYDTELLQLLILLVTWSVLNVTVDVNDLCLIFLDTSRLSREEVCMPSFDVVNCLLC